jgi:hypothetical protein
VATGYWVGGFFAGNFPMPHADDDDFLCKWQKPAGSLATTGECPSNCWTTK